MAVPAQANYVFLPWVRQGMASGIQTPDSLSANQAGVVAIPITLRINNTENIDRNVRLHGPGDVIGIDPQQVIRTEPRHLATDFEPNYFPAVEFDRPDFPWLFTPAKANATGLLRPWLCLVVVRQQDGVRLRADHNVPLPVLEITAPAQPARELPDLAESWAWAHAQVAGSPRQATALQAALAGDPALTVSRLVCPRRLDPSTEYLACVVPTFALGRKAGLGEPILPADEQAPLGLAPAWGSGAQAPTQVRLPVYFHWEFRTGTGGDFEALVRLLTVRDADDLPPEVGKRLIDISQPGFLLPQPLPPGTTIEMAGALRLLGATTAAWPDNMRTDFQTALAKILNTPWQAMHQEGTDPLLAPPIYGCWQAAHHTVALSPAPLAPAPVPPWLHTLNLDPRYRAVAALGTAVVQAQQEQLMAAAWEQLGEIERLNQMRRQAQLGRAVNGVYYAKHFARFSEERLLKVAATAQSRLLVTETVQAATTTMLLSHKIARSALPERAVSAPLRRLTSPHSVLNARFPTASASPSGLVGLLNTTRVVPLHKPEAGLVTLDQVQTTVVQLQASIRFERSIQALDTTPKLGNFTIVPEGAVPKRTLLDFTPWMATDSADAREFRQAAQAHHTYLAQKVFASPPPSQTPMPLSDSTHKALLHSLQPAQTMNARVQASLRLGNSAEPQGDPLAPIMEAPEFPQPMYEALRDLSQEWLFPGLEQVPPNTVALLTTNAAFVEAFLVGLNAEMSRELLWRNYPTDQRGTYFRHFWDTSSSSAPPDGDITPIHRWDKTNDLGANAHTGDHLVLLLRGELLHRYPNAVVYAVKAVDQDGQRILSTTPQDERQPLFRGTLKPDVTFLGFPLSREEALADPGYFFVIQQQPTEPRFGMDEADFTTSQPSALTTWNDLSWRHLADTREALQALSHASIRTVLPKIDKAEWGKNAAHQAYITLQRPVRIAIHARDMLTKGPR